MKKVWKLNLSPDELGKAMSIGAYRGCHGDDTGAFFYDYENGYSIQVDRETGKVIQVKAPEEKLDAFMKNNIRSLMAASKSDNITVGAMVVTNR